MYAVLNTVNSQFKEISTWKYLIYLHKKKKLVQGISYKSDQSNSALVGLYILILWILCVHEKGTFMHRSSVFTEFMPGTINDPLRRYAECFFETKSLNVFTVELFPKYFFNAFLFDDLSLSSLIKGSNSSPVLHLFLLENSA